MITLRRGCPEDRGALQAVLDACGMVGEISPTDCLVASNEGIPVGLACIEYGDGIPYLRPIAIVPQQQGQGIGHRMLQTIVTDLPDLRAIARGNTVAFYTSLGFQPISWDKVFTPFRQECEECPDFSDCSPLPMKYLASDDVKSIF